MAIDWDADVLGPVMSIFGEGTTGVPASLPIYRPRSAGPFTLTDAVFDAQYQRLVPQGDGSEISTSSPALGVRAAVFTAAGRPLPAQGDRVLIPSTGKLYKVVDIQPDSHGHIVLVLVEAAR